MVDRGTLGFPYLLSTIHYLRFMPLPNTAYIALGANLSDREKNIRTALHALDSPPQIQVVRVSQLMENPAVGGPTDSPDFLNAAAEIETTVSPQELLARLLEIEHSLGRD